MLLGPSPAAARLVARGRDFLTGAQGAQDLFMLGEAAGQVL